MNKTPKTPSSRIDWTGIHARMERARADLEGDFAPSAEAKSKKLKERAKVLAQQPQAAPEADTRIEIVSFLLAYENYAFESSFVRELYPLKHLCPLPGTPPFIAGIINVRGQIVSVVDLKRFFELPDKGLTDQNKVIILHDGEIEFGVLADTLLGVTHVSTSELHHSTPALTGPRAQYLRGVTPGRLIVLDAAKLMTDPTINNCQTNKTLTPGENQMKGIAI